MQVPLPPARSQRRLAGLLGVCCAVAWGCHQETPAECDDIACSQRWIEAHWGQDEQLILDALEAMDAQRDRELLVTWMAETWPGQTGRFCGVLPSGQLKLHCETQNQRPHLWQVDEDAPYVGRMAAGKIFPDLAVDQASLALPWAGQPPVASGCPDDTLRQYCIIRLALEAARQGEVVRAALLCEDNEREKQVNECFFKVSDRMKYAGRMDIALELCLGSGYFLDRCLGHAVTNLAEKMPQASSTDTLPWRLFRAQLAQGSASLRRTDPQLAERWRQRVLAEALYSSYIGSSPLTGHAIDRLDTEALPFVRSAVAMELWRTRGAEERSLQAWTSMLMAAMESREPATGIIRPPATGEPSTRSIPLVRLPSEVGLNTVAYPGGACRILAQDPMTDATICILHAAISGDAPFSLDLFDEALSHPEPLVRWTAVWILGHRWPLFLRRGRNLSHDESELVRARFAWETREDHIGPPPQQSGAPVRDAPPPTGGR